VSLPPETTLQVCLVVKVVFARKHFLPLLETLAMWKLFKLFLEGSHFQISMVVVLPKDLVVHIR